MRIRVYFTCDQCGATDDDEVDFGDPEFEDDTCDLHISITLPTDWTDEDGDEYCEACSIKRAKAKELDEISCDEPLWTLVDEAAALLGEAVTKELREMTARAKNADADKDAAEDDVIKAYVALLRAETSPAKRKRTE